MPRHEALRRDPRSLLPSATSVIAVSLDYYQEPAQAEPKIARYALGRDYHKVLRGRLRRLARWLEIEYPECENRICVDSAPILEREFAHMAGLGWFGKNTMLIDSRRGSWFFIGILLTSVEFQPDAPAVGGCGTCRKCIDACPTGAIVPAQQGWMVDSRACLSYLTIEHRGEIEVPLHGWTFGCDVCQEVCPFNSRRQHQPERAQKTSVPDFLAQREWPNLTQLSQIGQSEWDSLTRGSAVRRAGYEGLRRNAKRNLSPDDGHG